ncbi:8-oxo-dGTP diphosphatase MutT [bacterium]|jgi:8-oxo-dGTP diphosphatase|nr:8-oxo-dGTP diphosphatase MutT [bacterium]MBT6831924.1 8-oxo-dGTP diphosphatase MutT [bacterium]MBT6996620.1 8-oxo-dGTP diphosphatase MutT [bacterium]MBT7773040.1 8-oxo-dGTP diphosphatase MutT [bacterium]
MIEVTAAIIFKNEKLLIARRADDFEIQNLWEFPGGKIEKGETPEECLARELHEELGIRAEIGEFFAENVHAYPKKIVRLRAFLVKNFTGEISLSREHSEFRWIGLDELDQFTFAPADRPFVEKLK